MNAAGLAMLKGFETCRLTAYRDEGGKLTNGWGHTGDDVYEGQTITQAQADAWLLQDLQEFEDAVRGMVTVPLTDNQFSALVDFAFNDGPANLQSSTLLKLVNAGDFDGAAAQFPRWDHERINGTEKEVQGLLNRRRAEQALFQS